MNQHSGGQHLSATGVTDFYYSHRRSAPSRSQTRNLSTAFSPYDKHGQRDRSKSGPIIRPALRRASTSDTDRRLQPHRDERSMSWSDVLYRYVATEERPGKEPGTAPAPLCSSRQEKPSKASSGQTATTVPLPPSFDLNVSSLRASRTLQLQHCRHILDDMSPSVKSYLSSLFWNDHNQTLPIIRRSAFQTHLTQSQSQPSWDPSASPCYSPVLHLAILAVGLRLADTTRLDVRNLVLAGRETKLHRAVSDFVQVGGMRDEDAVAYVQTLVLLANLEYGCGLEESAMGYLDEVLLMQRQWEAANPEGLFVSDEELLSRHMVVRSTRFMLATYFSETSDSDLRSIKRVAQSYSNSRSMQYEDTETQIYSAQLDLAHLSSSMQAGLESYPHPFPSKVEAYIQSLDRWYNDLPEPLRWTEKNMSFAPLGFFLLHQQYFYDLIRIHRSFSRAHKIHEPYLSIEADDPASRQACHEYASRITNIMLAYSRRFRFRVAPAMAVQHASLAASVLLIAVSCAQSDDAMQHGLAQIRLLEAALVEMSPTYEQANRLSRALSMELESWWPHVQPDRDGASQNAAFFSPGVASPPASEKLDTHLDINKRQAMAQGLTPLSLDGVPDGFRESIQISPSQPLEMDSAMQHAMAEQLRNGSVVPMEIHFPTHEAVSLFNNSMDASGSREETEVEAAEAWGQTFGAVRTAIPEGHDTTTQELFGDVFRFDKLIA